jgi:hypothetical protein
MSADNALALQGAMDYGTDTYPSTFDPGCDAYRAVDHKKPGTTYFSAKSVVPGAASLSTSMSPTNKEVFPLELFKNVTNQPLFADAKTCDNLIRLFNTSLSTAPNRIESVKGTVKLRLPPFSGEQEWKNVYGLRFDSAFIENNYLPCENFRGYNGFH